jgi:hypothetical protein
MDVTKPYKFIWFGDIHGPKPYKLIGFGCLRILGTKRTADVEILRPGHNIGPPETGVLSALAFLCLATGSLPREAQNTPKHTKTHQNCPPGSPKHTQTHKN